MSSLELLSTAPALASLKNKKIVILGLGREGWSSFSLLRSLYPKNPIILSDEQPITDCGERWQAALGDHTTYVQLGDQPLPAHDLVIKTPGIPPAKCQAWKLGPTTTNLQLALELLAWWQTAHPSSLTTIGVTGTKGKSTTASLITHVLKAGPSPVYFGGNLGVPPLEVATTVLADSPTADQPAYIVFELSCHQLLDVTLSPDIAVVLNITPEHLDYYATFEEYLAAKSSITRFGSASQIVIYDSDFATSTQLAELSPGVRWAYGLGEQATNRRAAISDDEYFAQGESWGHLPALRLAGEHNLLNVLPAIMIGQHLGLTKRQIWDALETFFPLPHRLQVVEIIDGVTYINDSLSTTPEATRAAVKSLKGPVILLLGGHDRHLEYDALARDLQSATVRGAVLFPPTGEQIWQRVQELAPDSSPLKSLSPLVVKTMVEAVAYASRVAKPGDTVLLSPASPSFGVFKDYQDRGDQFAQAVRALKAL